MQRRVDQPDRHRQAVHRARRCPTKSLALQRQQRVQRRLPAPSSVSARISRSTSSRRSPRNMCSVRHSPIPAAPNRRARAASAGGVGVGAHAEPAPASACVSSRCTAGDQRVARPRRCSPSKYCTTGDGCDRDLAEVDLAGGAVDGDDVALARPVRPSDAVNCRSCGRRRRARRRRRRRSCPCPRATTAACEVLPPRLVRMPWAAIMPGRSSGLVSRRTRMTCSPVGRSSTARAESKTTLPTAAPGRGGDARGDRASGRSARSNVREHQLRQLRAGDPRAAPRRGR